MSKYIAIYMYSTPKNPNNLYPELEDHFYEVRHIEESKIYESYQEALQVVEQFKRAYGDNCSAYATGEVWLENEAEFFKMCATDALKEAILAGASSK